MSMIVPPLFFSFLHLMNPLASSSQRAFLMAVLLSGKVSAKRVKFVFQVRGFASKKQIKPLALSDRVGLNIMSLSTCK